MFEKQNFWLFSLCLSLQKSNLSFSWYIEMCSEDDFVWDWYVHQLMTVAKIFIFMIALKILEKNSQSMS